jgi:hypothetical protein
MNAAVVRRTDQGFVVQVEVPLKDSMLERFTLDRSGLSFDTPA